MSGLPPTTTERRTFENGRNVRNSGRRQLKGIECLTRASYADNRQSCLREEVRGNALWAHVLKRRRVRCTASRLPQSRLPAPRQVRIAVVDDGLRELRRERVDPVR